MDPRAKERVSKRAWPFFANESDMIFGAWSWGLQFWFEALIAKSVEAFVSTSKLQHWNSCAAGILKEAFLGAFSYVFEVQKPAPSSFAPISIALRPSRPVAIFDVFCSKGNVVSKRSSRLALRPASKSLFGPIIFFGLLQFP